LSIITLAGAKTALTKAGLLSKKIESLIETWQLDKYKYSALPSKTDLDRFLIKGIITEGQYRALMLRHGFSVAHTNWYLEDFEKEVGEPVRGPTKADLENFFKKGIIEIAEYRSEMSLMGYSAKHIEYYIKEM
ncbi:unnamed protein product, partial [marine sediment metagenome]